MTDELRPLPARLDPAELAALHDAARQHAAQLRAEAIAEAAVWLMRSVVTPAVAGVTSLFRPSRRPSDGAVPSSRRRPFPSPSVDTSRAPGSPG